MLNEIDSLIVFLLVKISNVLERYIFTIKLTLIVFLLVKISNVLERYIFTIKLTLHMN